MELATRYDPKEAQDRWYEFWEKSGYFHAEPPAVVPPSGGKKAPAEAGTPTPFTIVIPPPNVTGALHMGHALNNTLQDILIRWRRMQGYNTLWVPGTDHAGIATQAVVEKRLREQEGKTRHDLGREELLRRIWAWKDDYERRILNQLRKLGSSCDWQRTRFTFDEGCSRAVRETFFKMFKDGLIYRGKRLVNWDTQLQTSVADDETYTEEVKSGFWTFKYPVQESEEQRAESGEPEKAPASHAGSSLSALGSSPEYIRFSTTRPETMLGDTAVAVHPNDPRYKHLIGRTVLVPLVNRKIPIIADGLLADPELGTGCVKVTPAHDPNDYACWQRQGGKIGIINILNPDGTINEAGGKYAGMDRYEARDWVTKDMEALGLFEGREDRTIPLKFSDRSKTPIEPYLSDQWFVRMGDPPPLPRGEGWGEGSPAPNPPLADQSLSLTLSQRERGQARGLAELAMQAVRDGRVKIHPERYANTYLDWLGEKRDWCISRQLWWGHRIRVWTAMSSIGNPPEEKKRQLQLEASERLAEYFRAAGVSDSDFCIRFPNEYEIQVCVRTEYAAEAMEGFEAFKTPPELEVSEGQPYPSVMLDVPGFPQATEAALNVRLFEIRQEFDVLDTWFSSQLWPHSTLGWPERTRELEFYYPTSVLVTSRDIITLWVARMVIAGLYNCGDVPFRDVYITPKILDGFGQTMSKSKGNGVDPLDIIDKYGADALRFGIATMTTESQDARLPVGYECPFCQTYIAQKLEHQQMKPKALKPDAQARDAHQPEASARGELHKPDAQARDASPAGSDTGDPSLALRASVLVKPRIKCPSCKKDFQFSSPNFDPDPGEPVARVVSERFEQGRNFANKLWNAARFALMNLEDYSRNTSTSVARPESAKGVAQGADRSTTPFADSGRATPAVEQAEEERWILSRLADTITRTTEHLENFRFSEVAKTLYDFAWSEFCDWYVEMAKLRLRDPATRPTAQRVLAAVLDSLLRLLHPIMPFVTEQIWQALNEVAPERGLGGTGCASGTQAAPSVMIAPWPAAMPKWRDPATEQRMARLQELIKAVRNIRSNFNVNTRSRVSARVRCTAAVADELRVARPFIEQLAAVDGFEVGPDVTKPADSVSAVATDWELYVPLTGLIDRAAEIDRNRKLLQSVETQLKSFQAKLSNADFVAKAPPDVVELHRQRQTELQAQRTAVQEILRELGG